MAINFTGERSIEEGLIQQLTEGESQWTYAEHIKSEDALWDNFFQILEQNNVAILNGHPLTEDEKSQIRMGVTFPTFYKAGEWLSGENGIAQVKVQRSDAKLGTVFLMVHNSNDIAGGKSTYQVVNQIRLDKRTKYDRNRQTDVTLLINGLPMIHIELKSRSTSINEAFNQIVKYDAEGKFSGIYSTIQTFVISNGSITKYIAANKHYNLDRSYLTDWVNENNERVRELIPFAEEVLTIPMAHELVTDYTVLDSKRKSLLALRPYQIHATKSIMRAMRRDESGHIWHTTGSGKTLTSYKASKTMLKRRSLDKVLFLVDRKSLDVQTTNEFQSYAQNDTIDVEDTKNVHSLVTKLIDGKREVIVTTAQKLNYMIKRYERDIDKLTTKQLQEKGLLRNLKLAFIVDECHRAVSSQQQRRIDRFFMQPVKLWYGFTGTPIFIPKDVKGDLEATTKEQYGKALHTYTIKEAISDRNVLSFHMEYIDTLSEDDVTSYLEHRFGIDYNDPDLKEKQIKRVHKKINNLSDIEKESYISSEVYNNDEHRLEVIDQIINRSRTKLGLNNGAGSSYSSILTVGSIEVAQKYYKLLKEVLNGEHHTKLSKKVQAQLSDFPKFAITYSLSENDDRSIVDQTIMVEALKDYNELYGTSFTVENIDAYNRNLSERLARKLDQYKTSQERIDLVIVVNRLLTGFDAPPLSTLFIDREVLPPHSLIQAFSRTNRLYPNKRANIVTMRKPETYKQTVEDAIRMYSAGVSVESILAPPWNKALELFEERLKAFNKIVDSVDDILDPGLSEDKKKQYVLAFQGVDESLNDMSVYSEYMDLMDNDLSFEENFGISKESLEDYSAVYTQLVEDLKDSSGSGSTVFDVDMDYQLSSKFREEIDHNYIMRLMDRYNDERSEDKLTDAEIKEISEYIEDLKKSNRKLGEILEGVWRDIQNGSESVEGKQVIDILDKEKNKYIKGVIRQLSNDWRIDYNDLAYLVRHYRADRNIKVGWNNVSKSVSDNYDRQHTYPNTSVYALNIKKIAEEEIYRTINEEIEPLI